MKVLVAYGSGGWLQKLDNFCGLVFFKLKLSIDVVLFYPAPEASLLEAAKK